MDSGNKKRGRPPKAKDYNSPLAKRLRELCEGRTQQEIADGAGVTRQNLGKFLSGETKPDVDTLEKLATFFKVSTDYLLGRTDVKPIDPSLEAAHKYTGLSEKAVESLHEVTIRLFNSDLGDDDYKFIKARDYLIEEGLLDLLADSYSLLYIDSKLFYETIIQFNRDEVEYPEELELKCDVHRYNTFKYIEDASDDFDVRIRKDKENPGVYKNKIEKVWNNAKHNPPKE